MDTHGYPWFIAIKEALDHHHHQQQQLTISHPACWEAISRSANFRCASAMGWYLQAVSPKNGFGYWLKEFISAGICETLNCQPIVLQLWDRYQPSMINIPSCLKYPHVNHDSPQKLVSCCLG